MEQFGATKGAPRCYTAGLTCSHRKRPHLRIPGIVWVSGWPNAYRTFWLDPKGWGAEKMLAFEGQFSPKPEAPQAPG